MALTFKTWKEMEKKDLIIRAQWAGMGLILFFSLLLFWGWLAAPSRLTIRVPPDLDQGAIIKPGTIPPEDVYAFAFQMFSGINTWSFNGQKDYPQAIDSFRYFMTTRFYYAMEKDYQLRKKEGSLQRTRLMTGYTGMGYQPGSVKVLGDGAWEVNLKMHVVERVKGSVVKDVLIDYPLRIVTKNTSIKYNPWGLAIDGFYQPPKRIKTFV